MARKRRQPLVEAPPTAASSSSDDEPPPHQGGSPSSSENETPPKRTLTQKKPESFESETDSDIPPVKPIEPKKSRSKTPSVTVLASPAVPLSKRRSGSGATDKGTTPKKAKREMGEGSNDDGKKPLFQRLWSDDDEIVLLNGMIEFKVKKGVDPLRDVDGFLEFVKESLHADVNRGQIMSKVRALKKRFDTAKKKIKIVDPHGVRLFELSKIVWENDVYGNDSKMKSKDTNVLVFEEKEEEDKDKIQDFVMSRRGKEELKLDGFGNYGCLKEGLNLLDAEEKAEMANKWKKQNLEEMELYVKRLDLLKELTQKTLNAIKFT